MLLVSLVLYFMKPATENERHHAFTSWLQSSLKTSNNAEVMKQIKGLQKEGGKLESVIRKASALVKAHAGDFKLPVKTDHQDEEEVFEVLLKEWKASQSSSSGMASAVIIKQAHPYLLIPADGLNFHGKSVLGNQTDLSLTLLDPIHAESIQHLNFHTAPLTGGVAIGAP